VPVERSEEGKPEGAGSPELGVPVSYASAGVEDLDVDQTPLDIGEEGMKAALVCVWDTTRSYKVEQGLRQLDFFVSTAFSPKEALEKLHRNQYDVVVLDEVYGGTKLAENAVLQHFQFLPMHSRRHLFLCLLSENLPTLERMVAFRLGVDMILNVKDVDKAKVMFVRSMKEYKHFYRVFADELEKRGEF
jgi:CheY-like chemotaxis protein